MRAVRTTLFWLHLIAGLAAGVFILTMSATGVLLALQPQILEWLERDQRTVTIPVNGMRLPPSAILSAATAAVPHPGQATLTLASAPEVSATVSFGREGLRYVDPYRGTVTGEGAVGARKAFQWLVEFHRWFALGPESRPTARILTGGSSLLFAGLALTGLVLWWPRRRSAAALLRAASLKWPATPAARDFNWHTVIGFWCAPVILVLALSGAVLSFPWANRLLFTLAGTPPPAPSGPAQRAGSEDARRGTPTAVVSRPDYSRIDAAWATAEAQLPTWATIALRVPTRMEGPASFTITDAAHWNRFARSQLTISLATGAVTRWEPYEAQSRGQKWRGWARFAHTGELGGLAGQVLAGLASAGGVVLVWTGCALALRRFARAMGRRPVAEPRVAGSMQPVRFLQSEQN